MATRAELLAAARARTASRSDAVRIEGLDRVIRALDFTKPAVEVLEKIVGASAEMVAGEARRRAPVDVGLLKSSINVQTKTEGQVVTASIGTNVQNGAGKPYGAYMEFGTGLVHDHPSWPKARHVVPPAALMNWAERKGRGGTYHDAWIVANAITKRGGIKPRRYLRGSLELYESRIKERLGRIVQELKRRQGLS